MKEYKDINTVEDLYAEYNKQVKENQEAYKAFTTSLGEYYKHKGDPEYVMPKYSGPVVDYGGLEACLGKIIKAEFNLTDKQTGYIMGKAYENYHAYFGDMFYGAKELAEFVVNFPKD